MGFRNMLEWVRDLFPREYTATKCGHLTKRDGPVSAFRDSITMQMPKNESGSVDYCLDCVGTMTARCTWCARAIFIGSPVTLYPPRPGYVIPEHAVVYSKDPLLLVGCLSWSCADSGADRAGFWVPGEDGKGRVKRVPTAYEMIPGAAEPSAVVVNDLSDMNEAMNPVLVPLNGQRVK
jgi:hypothetical protein